MIRFIFWAIFLYCLVRFITNFVLPIYRATRQMKQQVRDFNEKVGQSGPQSQRPQPSRQHTPSPRPKSGDYIDFEEVRS